MTNDQDDSRGLQISAAGSGGVVVRSQLDLDAVKKVVPSLREVAGESAEIKARLVIWAGPYEIFMSIKPIIDTAVNVGLGVAALLTLYVKKHPEQPITIHLEQEESADHRRRSVTITGHELTKEEATLVNNFFRDHDDEPDKEQGGLNQPL